LLLFKSSPHSWYNCPQNAECFSFAELSAAKEKYYYLCDLCALSEAPQSGIQARAVISQLPLQATN
jgi:hypothetical protein